MVQELEKRTRICMNWAICCWTSLLIRLFLLLAVRWAVMRTGRWNICGSGRLGWNKVSFCTRYFWENVLSVLSELSGFPVHRHYGWNLQPYSCFRYLSAEAPMNRGIGKNWKTAGGKRTLNVLNNIWKQVMLWSGTSNVENDYIACSYPQQAM